MEKNAKWTLEDVKIFVANPVNVEEFRQAWLKAFAATEFESSSCETQQQQQEGEQPKIKMRPIPIELEAELREVCDENALMCAGESQNYAYASRRLATSFDPVFHNVPKDVNLVTLRIQREEIAKRWNDIRYMRTVNSSRKRRYDYETPLHYSRNEFDELAESVDTTDVVLTVTVCEPSRNYVKKCLRKGGLKYQVLGTQKLTELRDKIGCVADLMIPGDFSHNPDVPQDTKAKDLYKSGFFFINNIFYNDMRDPTCRNYSKVIMDWANADASRQLGPFEKRKMEETVFTDLEIQLGYPYLYTHQGNCEHLLVFNDLGYVPLADVIKMVNPDGCMDRSKYPLHTTIRRTRGKKCMLCHILTPRWITRNNNRLPMDPFFFCDGCFRSFNYDNKGEKIGDFFAHPYVDRTAIF